MALVGSLVALNIYGFICCLLLRSLEIDLKERHYAFSLICRQPVVSKASSSTGIRVSFKHHGFRPLKPYNHRYLFVLFLLTANDIQLNPGPFRDSIKISSVVRKMGILVQTSNFQNCIEKTNKIPEYARNYKNEWLFIRGINKECYKFEEKCEIYESKIFDSSYCDKIKYFMKRFLKFQEYGYLKDTSCFVFKKCEVFYIEDMNSMLKYIFEMYNFNDYYSGFSDFYNLFCKFYDKINVGYDDDDDDDDCVYLKTIEYYSDPRNKVNDGDSDFDSDDLEYIFNSDSDSDSD